MPANSTASNRRTLPASLANVSTGSVLPAALIEVADAKQFDIAHVMRLVSLGEFAATIAHEINQPLASIALNGETCLRWLSHDTPQIDQVRAKVAAIVKVALRSGDMIRQMQAFYRKSEIKKAVFDLNDLIEEVLPVIESEMRRNGVTLRLNFASDLPQVFADRIQLQQVAVNLLVNAIQMMASVRGRARELIIRSHRDMAGGVAIVVKDNGPGIDSKNLERVFAPFFTTKADGVGLGLAICKSIIEAHNGDLWATRNRGHGASFHFSLPAWKSAVRSGDGQYSENMNIKSCGIRHEEHMATT